MNKTKNSPFYGLDTPTCTILLLSKSKSDKPQTPIKDLGLSSRVFKLLIMEGCAVVEDLIKFKKKDIENISLLGKTSIRQIATKHESLGITDSEWSKV